MDEKQLITLTDQLLKGDFELPREEEAEQLCTDLRVVINFHDSRYYIKSDPLITDYDYDLLYKWLKLVEENYPEFITPDSPTQRVAFGLNKEFPTVQHLVPMMSLENSYNLEDLKEFDRRVKGALQAEKLVEYTIEPKFDGSSIALVYVNDVFVRAATRGNGTEGDEITANAKTIRSIPLKASFSRYGIYKIEVRGEVVIENETFKKLVEERIAQNRILREKGNKELEVFKHPRNTAAGALRMKDPKETASRKLDAIIYNIGIAYDKNGKEISTDVLPSQYGNMDLLHEMGFKTSEKERGRFTDIDKVAAFCLDWENKRDAYPVEIDGMVVKVDSIALQNLIGKTSHHPKWAIAYKFKARQAQSILRRVEFQVGRTGAVTPVAKIDPVSLTGVEISSISLHNEDFILDKNILLGDTVIVERAGDVIPYIVGPVTDKRTGSEIPVEFPKDCPSCGHHLVKPLDESIWRCINPSCPAQLEERLIHFVSKDAMEISGLGEEIIRRFLAEDIISGITDIYRLDYARIRSLEGWKDRSVENLRENVEGSKNQPMWRLIVGLGIRHVGNTTAKMLAKQVERLTDFKDWELKKLVELEDVGPKVAQSIYEFFHDEDNIALIEELATAGINIVKEPDEALVSSILEGKTFLFTGTLARMSRDDAKELVEKHGGKNLSGVSANLDYLVAGEKAGSKLTKAQKITTIHIIDEDTFLEMIS